MKTRIYLFTTILFLITSTIIADDLTWTGASGDNIWDNPNNWDGGKVPDKDDNVTIPEGSPVCCVDYARVNNMVNNGTLISENLTGMSINAKGSVANNGTIGDNNAKLTLYAEKVYNNYGGVLQGEVDNSGNPAVKIFGYTSIVNEGTIRSESNISYLTADIVLKTFTGRPESKILNYGSITAADGAGSVQNGGNVSIGTYSLKNYGKIQSGDGSDPQYSKDGKITIRAGRFENNGTIKGGKSIEKLTVKDELILGNVDIYADSILIQPDTNLIEAEVLSLYGNYINISDVSYISGIWVTSGVHIYTSYNGTADFSELLQELAIYSEYGDPNLIYSDNILESPQGLDNIFHPAPEIFPSDTNITSGSIDGNNTFNYAGQTDTLFVTMRNHSMLPKVLTYNISSELEWVETLSSATPMLDPFEFYNLELLYTIPEGTSGGTTDEVELILAIDDGFIDTAYCTIECVDSLIISLPEIKLKDYDHLFQNYPNPFSQFTTIEYMVASDGEVTLELYDNRGMLISILYNDYQNKGKHKYSFDGTGLKEGFYYNALKLNNKVQDVNSMIRLIK
jgi:hypothetical protein